MWNCRRFNLVQGVVRVGVGDGVGYKIRLVADKVVGVGELARADLRRDDS